MRRLKRTLNVALLVLMCTPLAVPAQDAERLPRTDRAPAIDGLLDEPVWQASKVFTRFTPKHPQPGQESSERTTVHLAYDHVNLYVGIEGFDRTPDKLRAVATSPIGAFDDDWVAFVLDPHDDALDAFFFLVTPAGIRVSGVLDVSGSATPTTALRWTSAATRTAQGYVVEMSIPFAQLPFATRDSTTMGFRTIRFISRRGEESNFPGSGVPDAAVARLQRLVMENIDRSRVPVDRPLFDVREAYREKLLAISQFGDTTLDARVRAFGDASALDYMLFPSRLLTKSDKPFFFSTRLDEARVAARLAPFDYLPGRVVGNLDRFLARTLTTSFIVIHDDSIVYEKYFNGWERDSIFTSFSTAKAFVSTLVGIAIDQGRIRSVNDPIAEYLPELVRRDPKFGRITIRDLLRMSSGLRYIEDGPPHDNQRTYMDPDLRGAALEHTEVVEAPGTHWLYNNYNPLLLGMILERTSGRSVTDLLQSGIWDPLGMEFDGSWSLDSDAHGFEKMESGINGRAIDFARFGRLFLNHGEWQGKRIVSGAWVTDATQPWTTPADYYGNDTGLGQEGHYYGYMWWGDRRATGESDYHAVGNKGQYIYVSPQKHLIIVRTGTQYGLPSSDWIRLFRQLSDGY